MKKFLLLTVMAVLLGAVLKAQETSINVKPNSRAGATIGMQIPDGWSPGYGGGLFYHQTLSNRLFLSLNAGFYVFNRSIGPNWWVENKKPVKTTVVEIPITLGINTFLINSGFGLALGLELGMSSSVGDDAILAEYYYLPGAGTQATDWIVTPVSTAIIPLTEKISLMGNIKLQLALDDGIDSSIGINLGIAYSIP